MSNPVRTINRHVQDFSRRDLALFGAYIHAGPSTKTEIDRTFSRSIGRAGSVDL
jgi:hypothetical protein